MEYLDGTLDTGPTEDRLYKFKSLQDHRGPYSPSNPDYLGSSDNILIEWETREITWEPIYAFLVLSYQTHAFMRRS